MTLKQKEAVFATVYVTFSVIVAYCAGPIIISLTN